MLPSLIVFGSVYLVYDIFAIAIAVWFLSPPTDKKRFIFIGMIATIITGLAALLAGALFFHPQPFAVTGFGPLISHEIDNAFPSHHVLAASLAASLAFLFSRSTGAVLFLLAIAVGASRIAAGLHYPIDVFASLAIAVASVAVSVFLISRFYPGVLESKN